MDMLDKLALVPFNDNLVEEINHYKVFYDKLYKIKDQRINKIEKKKLILTNAFESLVSLFDLTYDQKLKFTPRSDGDIQSIHLENFTDLSFDEVYYNLYFKSFCKYLERICSLNNNRVDDDIYTIARLAYLNNDIEIIKKLVNISYNELLDNRLDLTFDYNGDEITKEDVVRLVSLNKKRNSKLRSSVREYSIYDNLNPLQIKNVFACFSTDIYRSLKKDEKIHLANLLFNYYSLNGCVDNYTEYKRKITTNTTNKDGLKIVINSLIQPGRTMIIKKKNIDMINEVISGLPFIYRNETKKENIGSLDDLKNIVNEIRNRK